MLHEKVGKHGTRNRGRSLSGGSELIEQTLLTYFSNFHCQHSGGGGGEAKS